MNDLRTTDGDCRSNDASGLRDITLTAKLMALELSECNPRHVELLEMLERALHKIRKEQK